MAKRHKGTTPSAVLKTEHLLPISLLFNVLLVGWIISSSSQRQPHHQQQGGSLVTHEEALAWHGGHPLAEQTGSCYCNAAKYCLCTPSLAIDLVIVSGNNNDHVWLVRRKDTNQLATMGGFVQVGETVEAAVRRELMEEMNLALPTANEESPLVLLGVYSDPRRDARRHTVSAAFVVRVGNDDVHPVAGDDAKQVQKIALADVEQYSFFADHQTILMDFRAMVQRQRQQQDQADNVLTKDDTMVRSVCDWQPAEWMITTTT